MSPIAKIGQSASPRVQIEASSSEIDAICVGPSEVLVIESAMQTIGFVSCVKFRVCTMHIRNSKSSCFVSKRFAYTHREVP